MLHFINLASFVLAQDATVPLTPTVAPLPSQSTLVNELGMIFRDDPRGYPTEVGSFFDIGSYVESEPCYLEIMTSTNPFGITIWSKCCSENPSSVNCVNYNPADVCFSSVKAGDEIAIYAGKFGWYPTPMWMGCCSFYCESDSICNNSLYCRSYVPGWERWWPSWLYYTVVGAAFLFFMFAFFIALCCCCSLCGMSRGNQREKKHRSFTQGVQPFEQQPQNQQPQIIYIQADPTQTQPIQFIQADPRQNQPIQFVKAAEVNVPHTAPVTLVKQSSIQMVGGSDSDDTNVVLRPYHNI